MISQAENSPEPEQPAEPTQDAQEAPDVPDADDGPDLTPRQQRFVEEFLVDLNGTAAYKRAGYKPGSDAVAASSASDLLRKSSVSEAIREAMAERSERTGVKADRVVKELARIAFADPRKLFNADGTLKSIHELDDDTAAAVASLEVEEEYSANAADLTRTVDGYTKKLKLWPKVEALKLLAQHLRLLVERHEYDHTGIPSICVYLPDNARRSLPRHPEAPADAKG